MKIIKHIVALEDCTAYNLMESNGKAFGRAVIYNDDKNSIMLDMLTVEVESRKNGYGLKLQQLREQIGIDLGCKYSYLWVIKGSWMRKWYARRGYKYYSKNKNDSNTVWLRKPLSKKS